MNKTIIQDHRRGLSFILAFILAFVTIMNFMSNSVTAVAAGKTISQIKSEQKALDKKIKEAQANINATQKKLKAENDKQKYLQNQITNLEGQLALYCTKIDSVTLSIQKQELSIQKKIIEIEKNEDLFAERVHKLYISNVSSSGLSALLSAESFLDFLNKAEILKRISKSDKDMINTLCEQKSELTEMKKQLEKEKDSYVTTKKQMDEKQNQLNGLYAESEGNETELQKINQQYMKDKEKFKKQNEALEAEMQRIIASQSSGSAYGDGILKWPLPGHHRISSKFGWRYIFGKMDYHTGIDIPAPRGTNIVAADAGKVLWVKKVSYGYGWHLFIDHGNGYATLYAHASRIDVNVGDIVAKGQTVAGVGTTGTSTGYHLHFEVRVNGEQVDPIKYL